MNVSCFLSHYISSIYDRRSARLPFDSSRLTAIIAINHASFSTDDEASLVEDSEASEGASSFSSVVVEVFWMAAPPDPKSMRVKVGSS
jgi:hypothetical protein